MNAEPPHETAAHPAPQDPPPARARRWPAPPRKRWPDLKDPAIALVLGIAPFWLFLGFHHQVTANDRVVEDYSLNILGLVLAIAGIVMVFRMLRRDGSYGRPPRWWPRTALSLLAGCACLFQVAQSLGIYRVDPEDYMRDLRVVLLGSREPHSVAYAGLDAARRDTLARRAREADEGRLRDDVVTTAARLAAAIVQYDQYAIRCEDSYRRFRRVDLPSFLTAADRAYVDQAENATLERWRAAPCTARERQFIPGPLVDAVHRDRDVLALQVASYQARFGTRPPAAAEPPRAEEVSTEGLPAALGATVAEVQAAFATSAAPATDAEWSEPALAFPDRGVRVMFGPDGKAKRIVLDAPFAGSVAKVSIGDSLRSLDRQVGDAAAGPRGLGEGIGLNSYGDGQLVFRSSIDTDMIDRIILQAP
ncbi:hypothetical protein [Phreatobacter sp. AB_2022a]|uniref:hypothetical protein n=1 Tax=Phreatobacter sp. AB_2022a TaxID=3003134 RepID=UPI002286D707|nr:hypothetical protein [Phreatobacter sp. AB_2022a]MCZ0734905.1 hypothetical protein [Phreatobacter sp. AB_2022a]